MLASAARGDALSVAEVLPLALVALIGFILWAGGRRILKPGVAMAGAALGAGLGWVAATSFDLGVPAWAPAAFGALVLGCLAFVTYRVAIVGLLALVFGLAGPAAVVLSDVLPDDSARIEESSFIETELPESGLAQDDLSRWVEPDQFIEDLPVGESTRERLVEAREFGEQLVEKARSRWAQLTPRQRFTLGIACTAGFLTGLLIGTFAPGLAATLLTAAGGALLWLFALRALAIETELPVTDFLPGSTAGLLLVWAIASVIGLVIQWIFRPRPADKPDS